MSNDVYFSADLHLRHFNIACKKSKWGEENSRGFDTLQEHDEKIYDNINSLVKAHDKLYLLGDLTCDKSAQQVYWVRKRIRCNNIYLILGNHDKEIRRDKRISIPFTENKDISKILGYQVNPSNENGDLIVTNLQKLFKGVYERLDTKINNQSIVMSHYSQRTWNKGHFGTWMLYGHSHNKLPEMAEFKERGDGLFVKTGNLYKTMDVGIDTHPEFRPYHFDEISTIMESRIPIGHH